MCNGIKESINNYSKNIPLYNIYLNSENTININGFYDMNILLFINKLSLINIY